jgi:hypothetical protein
MRAEGRVGTTYIIVALHNFAKAHIKGEKSIRINVAIPADKNVMQKKAEKYLKYKSLCMEIRRMWKMKCMNIPVINGTTRMAITGSKKVLKAIPGNIQ